MVAGHAAGQSVEGPPGVMLNAGARLPEGWKVKVNPITQQPYYKKVVDGHKETSYVPPREPPRQPTEEEAIIEREQLMEATRAVYRKHDPSLVESVEIRRDMVLERKKGSL